MKITKGTSQAMAFLKKLKKEGYLTDVYSDEFFNRQPTHNECPESPYYKDGMSYVNDIENDEDESQKPKGHLLYVHINEYEKELIKELLDIYPPLTKQFEAFHKPDFLIINLYTKQVLCLLFGRKNRLIAIDSETGKLVNLFGLTGGDSEEYAENFTEHDYFETVRDFVNALSDLSEAMFERDHLPANYESLSMALIDGPKKNGLYYAEGNEDRGYSNIEIQNLLRKYDDIESREEKAMKIIQIFFPSQDYWELNTGDY